jgi:hypothetical protein
LTFLGSYFFIVFHVLVLTENGNGHFHVLRQTERVSVVEAFKIEGAGHPISARFPNV